jgi:hypothetical protein
MCFQISHLGRVQTTLARRTYPKILANTRITRHLQPQRSTARNVLCLSSVRVHQGTHGLLFVKLD